MDSSLCPSCINMVATLKEVEKMNLPPKFKYQLSVNIKNWAANLPKDVANTMKTNCVLLYFNDKEAYGFCPIPKFYIDNFIKVLTNNHEKKFEEMKSSSLTPENIGIVPN